MPKVRQFCQSPVHHSLHNTDIILILGLYKKTLTDNEGVNIDGDNKRLVLAPVKQKKPQKRKALPEEADSLTNRDKDKFEIGFECPLPKSRLTTAI